MAKEAKDKNLSLREIVKDASLLAEKRKELDNLRRDDWKQWVQNREFYKGNQWVFWNDGASQLETLGVDDLDKPRYKVRLTNNQLTPAVNTLVAQLTKTRPVIHATPDSGGDKDVKAAQMAERLYEYWWIEFGMKSKLTSALVHAQISQGFWLISWDPLAGKPFRVMTNPQDGGVITDERLADLFREEITSQAEAAGMQPEVVLSQFEKVLSLGDIKIQVLSGEQVWLDPVPSNFEDVQYAICKYPMDVDEIEARYGVRVTPDSVVGEAQPTLAYTKAKDERPKTAREVYVLYVRPGALMKKGKYVVWIESPNQILYSSDWEFPTNDLPLVQWPGIENPNSPLFIPRMTLGRPLQKEINATVSSVVMHKNMTLKPQMLAPVGSLRQRLTSEPGAVFEYSPVGGMGPEWRTMPDMPQYVFAHLEDMQRRLDRLFNLMPTERSQLPARTDSGELVDLVHEAVADQLSLEVFSIEDALARAGMLMAALAKQRYIEPRLLKIRGEGGSVQVQKFLNSDLEGGFTFHAEAGSGLPRTRAGRMRQIKELVEMQIISPQEAIPYLDIAGLKHLQSRVASDEEFAYRKIEKILRGEPLNVPAMQQAAMAAQSGVNPQSGQPFTSPDEAMQFVQQAAMSPMPFENLGVTLNVLSQHMKGVEFEKYDPALQQQFLMHFGILQQAAMSQTQVPQQPVKTTLSLKGTVGPTVAADILSNQGVRSATPQTMAEPPLETSVYDSMDKPDADSAGNDQLTQMEMLQSMQQAEDKHGLATAKMEHDTQRQTGQDSLTLELHDQKLRHNEEAHQERLRQMRNPKPSGENGR